MYKKEIERKWLVKKDKLPNLSEYPYVIINQGYLSQLHDSLMVRVRSVDDKKFTLDIKDSGTKIRNEITFNISKEEFDVSFQLSGQKTIRKRRYSVPSSFDKSKILEVDVFDDFDLIVVEYEANDETLVDSLPEENWFSDEVTEDLSYTNIQLAYRKI
jgi:CYTH domain-containing protein